MCSVESIYTLVPAFDCIRKYGIDFFERALSALLNDTESQVIKEVIKWIMKKIRFGNNGTIEEIIDYLNKDKEAQKNIGLLLGYIEYIKKAADIMYNIANYEAVLNKQIDNDSIMYIPDIFAEVSGAGLSIDKYYAELRLFNIISKREERSLEDVIQQCLKQGNLERGNSTIIVAGEAGSGKTTLIKYTINNILKHREKYNFKLVLYVELKNYKGDLEELIFGKKDGEYYIDPVIIKKIRNKFDYIIFLDGFNEVAYSTSSGKKSDQKDSEKDQRNSLKDQRDNLKSQIEKLGFFSVVTTRNILEDLPSAGDHVYIIQPLARREIKRLSEKLIRYYNSKKDVDSFMEWIKDNNILPLASNPMLLWILCYIFATEENIKIKTRKDLLKVVINKIVNENIKKCTIDLTKEDILKICRVLAYKKLLNGRDITEDELDNIIKSELNKDIDKSLFISYCPFITLERGIENRIKFTNSVFEEYFAAEYCYLKRGENNDIGYIY